MSKLRQLIMAVGVVSASLEPSKFGGSVFWWSAKIKFCLRFQVGDGIAGILVAVLPPTFSSLSFGGKLGPVSSRDTPRA